jgi:hypothetical protein
MTPSSILKPGKDDWLHGRATEAMPILEIVEGQIRGVIPHGGWPEPEQRLPELLGQINSVMMGVARFG